MALGGTHACFIKAALKIKKTNSLFCWGDNESGQLDIPSGCDADIHTLATGYSFTCGVYSGIVRCWGGNSRKQLDIPQVLIIQPLLLTDKIAVGDFHVCATRRDQEILCWGDDD